METITIKNVPEKTFKRFWKIVNFWDINISRKRRKRVDPTLISDDPEIEEINISGWSEENKRKIAKATKKADKIFANLKI